VKALATPSKDFATGLVLLHIECVHRWTEKRNEMRPVLHTLFLATVIASAAFAQKVEVYGDYTYMQFNTTITGTQSRAFNGGGGGFQFNMGQHFGLKGDFQGYMSTEWTAVVTSPITTPQGTIRPGTYTTSANMFTYLFGPEVHVQSKKVRVFGELLFGGSSTSGYANILNEAYPSGAANNPSQHPFTMAFGGGLDVNVSKKVALRLGEMDWILTRYTNPFTLTNNQNSFRYLGGIVFKFGGS
jgi:hypothetical protein